MIKKVLSDALRACQELALKGAGGEIEGNFHSKLSQYWIEFIASDFRAKFPEAEGYRVFSKGYDKHRSMYKMNEFLFDITVIKAGWIPSASGSTSLEYPLRTLWHIESEFQSNDSKASIVDFGKLLMSAAENKLMILPSGGKIEQWAKENLTRIASEQNAAVQLAFVPHPATWQGNTELFVRVVS